MAQPTQAEIRDLTDQWGEIEEQIQKKQAAKLKELTPIYERHNEEIEGVSRKFDTAIAKLRDQQVPIEARVIAWLDKRSKDVVIAGETAEAIRKTETKGGARIIDFEKFWKIAKAKGQAAVECINVRVLKAEKLLGKKTIDEISEQDKKDVVTTELRLID